MFFSKVKKSISSSSTKKGFSNSNPTSAATSGRRPLLSGIYNSILNMKTAFSSFDTHKRAYDPFQMKQYADESGFNPYYTKDTQDIIYMQEDDNFDVFYDACEEPDTALPAPKRLRTLAASVVDTASHSLIWGTMAAAHYVFSEKKHIEDYFTTPKKNTITPAFKDKPAVAMRGFGVDFPPLFEKNPTMQLNIDKAEKKLREICYEQRELSKQQTIQKKLASCGGNPLKRSIDETWGFVERDYSVNFKPTLLPPPKPPRRVYVNHQRPNAHRQVVI